MKHIKFLLGLIFILSISFAACSEDNDDEETIVENTDGTDDEDDSNPIIDSEDFETNTKDTLFTNAITINFTDSAAQIVNPYEGAGITITQENGHVVVNSTMSSQSLEVNYVVSGQVDNGSLKIYSDYKFGLAFNGVSITNPTGPAVNIQAKKKVTVYLVGGTSTRLIDGTTYTAYGSEDMKGTFFSEGQLNFQGNGNLYVKGIYKHAICSDDYIYVRGGNITVTSAASDAIHAKDYFRMSNGTLDLKASSDGIDCDEGYITIDGGSITVKSADDGIVASYEDADALVSDITINGGTINVTTSGEKAMGIKSDLGGLIVNSGNITVKTTGVAAKAFKTGGNVTINGGEMNLTTTGSAFYDTSDLDISSAAGVNCDGNMLVENGTITINSSGAGGKGISVDGTLTINNGTIKVTTTGGQYKYNSSNDTAAKAIKSDGNLTVNGGTIVIRTSGVEAEGLESKATLTITGGDIDIEAYDDCINASNHIEIGGGKIYCYSQTNDGIDSNGTMTVTGGTIVSVGSSAPEEGFDCDQNTFKITGGILLGFGGATSSPTASVSTQYSLIYNTTGTSGEYIGIQSSAGTNILTVKVPRTYSQMTMLFSSPSLAASTSYTIYKGGTVSGGSDFHGYYTGSSYSGGTSSNTFTTSAKVTTVGTSTGGGGGRP